MLPQALIRLSPEEEDDSQVGPALESVVHTPVDDYEWELPVLEEEVPIRAYPADHEDGMPSQP